MVGFFDAFLFVKSSPGPKWIIPWTPYILASHLFWCHPLTLPVPHFRVPFASAWIFFFQCVQPPFFAFLSVLSSDFVSQLWVASALALITTTFCGNVSSWAFAFSSLIIWASRWYRREKNDWRKSVVYNFSCIFSVSAFCPHLHISSSQVQSHSDAPPHEWGSTCLPHASEVVQEPVRFWAAHSLALLWHPTPLHALTPL